MATMGRDTRTQRLTDKQKKTILSQATPSLYLSETIAKLGRTLSQNQEQAQTPHIMGETTMNLTLCILEVP